MVFTAVVVFFLILFVADERAPLVLGVHVLVSVRVRVLLFWLLVITIIFSRSIFVDDPDVGILTQRVFVRSAT